MSGIEFKTFTSLTDTLLDDVMSLDESIFDEPFSREKIRVEAASKRVFFGIIAYENGKPIAYKLGFDRSTTLFYSWIGGVRPEARGRGLAKEMMTMQHAWCKENGFKKVRTHSENQFKNMMILNLNCGFRIIGTYLAQEGKDITVMFEKDLVE